MPLGRFNRTLTALALSAAAGAATLTGGATDARADGPVTGTGKGIVGGALLGGEVVSVTMAAIGVQKGWPYFAFGGVGAIGGGIGGYFVEQAAPAEVPLYMLAGGMAFIIPTLVAVLNATSYQPPESDTNDPVTNEPAPEPPAPVGSVTIPRQAPGRRSARVEAPPHIPLSLVDIHRGRLALGLPAIEIRPLYTEREMFEHGVKQGHEVRVPVLRAMF